MNKVSSENKGLKCKIEESNKLLGDKTDFVDILENTVRNKVSEIEMLRLEMKNFCKNQLSCVYCEYETDEDGDMKDHIKSLHGENEDGKTQEIKCDVCEYKCKTRSKLKNHMCRMFIENPSFKQLCVKNWIIPNGCTSLFSKKVNQEIAILHSEDCIKNKNQCPDLPDWYPGEHNNYDGSIWHNELGKYLFGRKIDWSILNVDFEG